MMNKKIFFKTSAMPCMVALLLAGSLLNACSGNDDETIEGTLSRELNLHVIDNDTLFYSTSETAEPYNATEEKINSALEDYAVTMLVDYSNGNKKNTMLSPVSATLLYSMISSLTDDTSASQYQRQLGLGSYHQEDISSYCRKLNYQTKSLEKANTTSSKFSIENNCWIQESEPVYMSFVSTTKSYGIGVKGVNFKSPSGMGVIEHSLNGGSISDSYGTDMTPLDDATSVVTTSMDFQKKWKNTLSYVKKDTVFTNADGTVSICKKLGGTFTLRYAQMQSFDMVELPYDDDVFALYVVYPHSSNLFDQTLSYIQKNGIEECINKLSTTKVSIRIPAFKLDGVTELNSSNTSSGAMGKQFYKAKLTKASPKGFNIGNTYQAYHIELNTHGTSVEVLSSGLVIDSNQYITGTQGASPGGDIAIPELHVDRPFIIFIRNNILKTIAYACSIRDLSD